MLRTAMSFKISHIPMEKLVPARLSNTKRVIQYFVNVGATGKKASFRFQGKQMEHLCGTSCPVLYAKGLHWIIYSIFPCPKGHGNAKTTRNNNLFHLLLPQRKQCTKLALEQHTQLFWITLSFYSLLSWLMKTSESRLTINALFYHLQSSSVWHSS